MKSKIMVLVVVATLICSNYILAAEEHSHSEHAKAAAKANNVICPVSGENVEAMGGGIEHEHNGKIYNLCCAGCVDIFEKDPEKYSKNAEANVKDEHKGSHHAH